MANHHGDFIWYELISPHVQDAEAFYGPLLGWRFGGDESYRMIEASEGHVGGLLPLSPDMAAQGARPAWIGYVMVSDVDDAVRSITDSGGAELWPAREMAGVGRIAMVADPEGAPFYVMTPSPPEGVDDPESHAFSYDRPRQGHCAWNELATSDPANAKRFYARHFGWVKDGEMEMPGLGAYEFLRHAGRAPDGAPMGAGMLGAVMPLVPGMTQSAWTFYFRVPDIDAAHTRIEANGGTILQPPIEIPGGDYSLTAADPHGAAFGLVGARTEGAKR